MGDLVTLQASAGPKNANKEDSLGPAVHEQTALLVPAARIWTIIVSVLYFVMRRNARLHHSPKLEK